MNNCIEWEGAKTSFGYGKFKRQGKMIAAHRSAWESANGKIPEGLCVLHRCDNPPCINVEHLFLGTHADNIKDCYNKGRRRGRSMVGSLNYNKKITEQTAVRIKMLKGSVSAKFIANILHITPTQVCQIMNDKAWKHVTAKTRYAF